ncbi:MAG: hypothetical protein JW857_11435 [Bacteroidales bacterium]|nr:hypothetical protein [Bacteroidales bacterium]
MVQDIIVYIILGLTALHIIRKSIQFFKPNTAKGCSSCVSGSCANCSLKFDMSSIQIDHAKYKGGKNS